MGGTRRFKVFRYLGPLVGLAVFALAMAALYHQLHTYRLGEILRQVQTIPTGRLLLSVLLVAGSYLAATGYDTLAIRSLRRRLPYGRTALAAFIGTAFSNNLGFGPLTGGSVRLRLYTGWELTVAEVTRLVIFNTLTLWLGFLFMGGFFFTFEPLAVPQALRLPFPSVRPLGLILLAGAALYIGAILLVRRPLKVRSLELRLPPPALLPAQLLVSAIDWGCAGAALYLLLPPDSGLSFYAFYGAYLLGLIGGIVSQVPGGLGVFETVLLLLLSPRIPAAALLGILLAFRGLFYLGPLALAVLLLAVQELHRVAPVRRAVVLLGRWTSSVVPPVLAVGAFAGGVVLMVSGATPAAPGRLNGLLRILPLPFIEVSHLLGSVIGVCLVLVARAIQRRIDAAYPLTVALLAGGIVFSLAKGFDYEEAIVLAVLLALFLPSRRWFYRRSSLLSPRFSAGWISSVGFVLIFTTWLTRFAFRHVEYSGDLWWSFALHHQAPRSMRALVGIGVVVLAFALRKLIFPPALRPVVSDPPHWETVERIVRDSPESRAALALLGDKRILMGEAGDALIMYNTQGRSWVSMGDPLGPPGRWPELIWRFRDLSDRAGGWTVFYEVGADHLPLYIDLGLGLFKLGEEARVPLERFSLDGPQKSKLRYALSRTERDGYSFELLPCAADAALLPELRAVSDSWLAGKSTREKGFALGFFDEGYLRRFPVGVVRGPAGLVAFANLWTSGSREEVSVDLMRQRAEAPASVMEYLFVRLILWGREQGYRWFSLGMAPLAGIESRRSSPMWNRLATLIYRRGEHFYNYQGLRRYKDKFDPVWTPRYLAAPGGLALPGILANVAALISRGLGGILTR